MSPHRTPIFNGKGLDDAALGIVCLLVLAAAWALLESLR